MLNQTSTTAIARIVLLAGILLALAFLASRSFFPAFAQEAPIEYAENSTDPVAVYTGTDPEGEVVNWDIEGADAADFSIEEGALSFDSPPNFESPTDRPGTGDTIAIDNLYEITVRAHDGPIDNTDTEFTSINVMVRVFDLNEPGVVTFDKLQPKVARDQAQVASTRITATLMDPDGRKNNSSEQDLTGNTNADENITWMWERSENSDGPWTDITATSTRNPEVNLRTRAPEDADVGHFLRATAMYFDGNSPEDAEEFDKSAQFVSDHPVISADYLPKPPVFLDDEGMATTTAIRFIAENSPAETPVGDPVTFTDIGADGQPEILTYAIDGADANLFAINDRSGQISVGDGTDINYEDLLGDNYRYEVTVTATDPRQDPSEPVIVTIMVTGVNEAPVISGATSTSHAENADQFDTPSDGTYSAPDPEGDDDGLTWSLSGSDRNVFDINAGVLSFKSPPDFERPTRSNNNVYKINVEVSDRGDDDGRNIKKASLPVEVTVTNEQEGESVTLSTEYPAAGIRITATLDEPDRVNNGRVMWTWTVGSRTSTSTGGITSNLTPEDDDAGAVTARAEYQDGTPTDNDRGPDETTAGQVRARDQKNNVRPVFMVSGNPVSRISLSVSENENAGTFVGIVNAEDSGDVGGNTITEDITYSLVQGSDASFFEIDAVSGQITTDAVLDRETKNPRTVSVRATDPFGGSTPATVSIEITDDPEPPVITSGSTNERYQENDTRVVSTYRATDQEDDKDRKPLTWSLSGTDDDGFTINARGELRFKSAPNFETKTSYSVTVEVTDSTTTSGPDRTRTVAIDVINLDEPGTVTLPRVQPKVGFETRAGIDDPDGSVTADTLTWQWARSTSRNGPWTDIEENSTSTTYTSIAADFNHYLQVTATYKTDTIIPEDDPTTLDVDESFVTARGVTDDRVARGDYSNIAPVYQDAEGNATTTATRMVDENSPGGTNVGLSVAATDLDVNGNQENLSYAFETGGNAALFTIVEGTGQIRVGPGDPFNYEDPNNPNHQYTVTIRATDPSGLHTGTAIQDISVTIMVVDVEEDPEIVEVSATENLSEKDYEEEQATTSEVSFYSASDHEDAYVNAAEDRDEKDLKWSLSGRDMDDFTISTSSAPMKQQLRFKESPSYERPTDSNSDNVYNVTVVVTDSAGRTDTRDVTVTVKNIDERGTVTLSNLQPEAGIPITATLEDPDGGVTNVRWQWFTAGDRINAGTPIPGANATERTYTPDDVHATPTGGGPFHLRAVATYNDNASVADDPATTDDVDEFDHEAATSSLHEVQLQDDMNESPQFTDQDPNTAGKQTTREIPENEDVDPGTVGASVTATDEPTANGGDGEVLTYSLRGPDAGLFTIDRGNDTETDPDMVAGQIRVAEGTDLDYETRKTYTVVVRATDPSLATDEITVTIEVTDFNEDPVIMMRGIVVTGDTSVAYPENGTAAVATYSAAGADAAGAIWSLEGTDAGVFSISPSGGVMTFNASPNFEAPADQGGNNVYNVTVKATSGTISMSRNVNITVTNEDEDGEVRFTSTSLVVRVGVELEAELDEADDETNVTWQWASGGSATGPWTPIGGATNATYTPLANDAGDYLQVTASYTDASFGSDSQSAVTSDAVAPESTAGTPGTVALDPTTQLTSGDSVTAILTDADNPVASSYVWRWQRSANGSTNWSNISGATSASYTTTGADAGNYLRATVTYDDDSGTGETADASTSSAVKLHRYDGNANGEIERTEVIDAINAYLFGTGTDRDEVIDVINLYLFG